MRPAYRSVLRTPGKVLLGMAVFLAVCTALLAIPIHLMHEEPKADLPMFFLLFWGVTGCGWVLLVEQACFVSVGVRGDYLVLCKATLIPVRRYIRLDQVTHMRRRSGGEFLYSHGRQIRIMDNERYLIYTRFGKVFRSSLMYHGMFEERTDARRIWGEKSRRGLIDPAKKRTFWRIAWDAAALRIGAALLAAIPFQPWRFLS